jgi:hypothetical protein
MPYVYRSEREIAAPAEIVWDILADLDAYIEWNPFCPYAETDRVVGHPIVLYVDFAMNWPPRERKRLQRQVETVSRFAPGEMLGWTTTIVHDRVFHAERLQWVEVIGEGRCRYRNQETFAGPLAWLVDRLYGAKVQRGFEATADALVKRAEARAR